MFILFLTVGIASASQNNTPADDNISSAPDGSATLTDSGSFDEIVKSIGDTGDNGTIELEGKQYGMSSDVHIILNKSLNFEGVEGTVIDGNSSSLYLESAEKQVNDSDLIHIYLRGYELKNTGKHVTFKNITFANIDLVDWHEMDFIDCRFINSRLTNYEMNNTFEKSVFLNSTVEMKNPMGMLPENCTADHSRIRNCKFDNSSVISSNLLLNTYIEIIGGSRYEIINTIDLCECNFSKSNLEMGYYRVNVDRCDFNDAKWNGWSCELNINSSSLTSQDMDYHYSIINAENSVFVNDTVGFRGGYFSRGCTVALNTCKVNNTEIIIDEGMHSGKSLLNISHSNLSECFVDCKYCDISIDDTVLEKTGMCLSYTETILENTTLINNKSLSEIFKTYSNNFTFINSYLVNESGKTELSKKDTAENNLESILIQDGKYCVGDELIITIVDSRGNPVKWGHIRIVDSAAKDEFTGYADENGTVKYLLQKSGKIILSMSTPYDFGTHDYTKTVELNVKSTPIKITASSITTTYGNRGTLKIKLTSNKANSTLNGFKLTVKVFTGSKYKKYEVFTKSNGIATFKTPANLATGKHKVEIATNDLASKKVTVTVNKAKTIVKAPKVTGKFKKSKYFQVTVKNKATKKAVSNVKVKIKVYTGKKYIIKTVKTNSKGIAKFNTKSLKIGKHNVVVSSGNSNYQMSAKSTITIKK